MAENVIVVMAQINPIVGDILGNVEKIIDAANQAKLQHNADMVVFSELTITGYPPEDLLLRDGLYAQVNNGLLNLCQKMQDVVLVVGYPAMDESGKRFNMAAWIENGQIKARYMKQNLPNYSVFDEQRYFSAGNQSCVVEFKGIKFGLLVCEDVWQTTPATQAVKAGADVLLNLNASPFSLEKHQDRLKVVARRVSEVKKPILYVNQVGGQDELVFDGGSFAMDAQAQVKVQAPEFETALTPVNIERQSGSVTILPGAHADLYEDEARVYKALIQGVADYVNKNHFSGVLLGLSGGIDSALTLAVAVDALGADRVEAVMMPFHFTAKISLEDAEKQANTLGVKYSVKPIESIYNAFESALAEDFLGLATDVTEENLQARIRGTLLMALSNKSGKMVLATSNKSEVAVGYSTLYGDMVGGFSPLKDVPKTLVYQLSKYRNSLCACIPERVISRAPSAELRADQRDQDSLPDYDELDGIINAYVKLDQTPEQIARMGYDLQEIRRVIRMIDRSEYKRRQSSPGIRITHRAFGRDRRYPITNGYIE